MVFNSLHPTIRQLLKKEGMKKPTAPQIKAIPPILDGKNVLLIAPTGMGKTEAALLPIFHRFLDNKKIRKGKEKISILYITPLRALNRDMLRRTFDWGKYLGIKIAVRHGDTSAWERRKQSLNPPDMLITTPETLQIMFIGSRLRKNLKGIRWLIIDEIHELAGEERGAQLSIALERLSELARFQRIGLSATIGTPEEVALYMGGAEIVEVESEKKMEVEVEFGGEMAESIEKIKKEISNHRSTLLFVNTRDRAEMLASRFNLENSDLLGIHHGSLSKDARIEAEDDFKEGKIKGLICTSSLELGIDIGNTDCILQYNSPRQVTRLVQRIGRAGHSIGETSRGKIMATNPEDLGEALVIARRALNGELEEISIRENPLSVLANQIISMALEYGNIEGGKMYEIIKRAYPFRNLSRKKFKKILEQLWKQGSIWYGNVIGSKRESRKYFIENISMIPDEKSMVVIDALSKKKIGQLDESFAITHCHEGASFIMKGKAWRVIEWEGESITVAPGKIGEIPDWTGEEIPVPYEVAMEVGRLRRMVTKGKKVERKEIEEYPGSLRFFEEQVEKQIEEGYEVPTDKTITIEGGKGEIIINAPFGSKTNEALGRIIAALLSQKIGESVGIGTDPYRMRLKSQAKPAEIKKILFDINPETLEGLTKIILKNSSFIKWQLIRTARKFGLIEKDAEQISMDRLIKIFKKMAIFDEAIEKTIWDRMDLINAAKVIKEIRAGEIDVHIQGISPIGLAGEESRKELFLHKNGAVLHSLKKRLEETRIWLICMNCDHFWRTTIVLAPEYPKCPRCGGMMIACIKGKVKEFLKLLKNERDNKKEKMKYLSKNASLVASYGKKALLTLAGYGIGPDTAARILARQEEGDDLLRSILEAEITYARTKKFWD